MNYTPNWFATFALLSWPLVALCLYRVQSVTKATLWTILGAHMLLPVGAAIKFQGIPAFDKFSIPNLVALIACLLLMRRPFQISTGSGVINILVLTHLVGPFITAELNGDPIVLANQVLPSATHYDALSAVYTQCVLLLPFLLGRQLLRSPTDNEEILRVLVIAGLIYSLPMLFEIRMSPQLHRWVYGYHAHHFDQQIRDGGYRPTVFMGHGLIVAFFTMAATVAAAALWRTRSRIARLSPAGVTIYMSAMLLLCKSLGALVYGVVVVALVSFARPRLQLNVAVVLVGMVLCYPALRFAGLFPTDAIVEAASSYGSSDRAASLKFRFDNEDVLLDRASERFFFGWGRFGRARVHDEKTGADTAITDGRWIGVLGDFGLFGVLAEFGLLAFPVFRAWSALRYADSMVERTHLAALALILAISVVDLLPNATLRPWTWLLAGALLGRTQALYASVRQRKTFEPFLKAGRSADGGREFKTERGSRIQD